jgi:hypothetical protein
MRWFLEVGDIALRCPPPASSGRDELKQVGVMVIRSRRLTLRSATGKAQRAFLYQNRDSIETRVLVANSFAPEIRSYKLRG